MTHPLVQALSIVCATVLAMFVLGNARDLVKAWRELRKGDHDR